MHQGYSYCACAAADAFGISAIHNFYHDSSSVVYLVQPQRDTSLHYSPSAAEPDYGNTACPSYLVNQMDLTDTLGHMAECGDHLTGQLRLCNVSTTQQTQCHNVDHMMANGSHMTTGDHMIDT